MAKKPPRRNRRVNCGVSVDLGLFLEGLARALRWKGDPSQLRAGRPGCYERGSRDLDDPCGFSVDYLFTEIMSKFDDGDKSSDELKTSKALAKFREAEELCKRTNSKFDKYFNGRLPDDPDVALVLKIARRKISDLLGELNWDELAAGFAFTSGGSAKLPRIRGAAVYKFSNKIETTAGNEPAITALLEWIPAWGHAFGNDGPHIDICEGNRVICVPKNYKVHRTIAAEPFGNMFIQKGFGAALRKRLKRVGSDLDNQVQNQNWALLGSVTDLIATVDLSMASDTVAKTFVEWMLPSDWVAALDSCRSPIGVLSSGEKVLYRKWSSMGNAYTFELESMIFWALAEACCIVRDCDRRFVSAYGDDIVCPSRAAPLLLDVLEECGFVPNRDKTFLSGPFRESCGKHYFGGYDVTPFYIRAPVKRLTDLFLLVNNLERWRRRMLPLLPEEVNADLMAFIKQQRSLAPSQWRKPRIPDGFGDGAFIGSFEDCTPARPRGKWLWWEGWSVEVLAEVLEVRNNLSPKQDTGEMLPVVGGYNPHTDRSSCGATLRGFSLASLHFMERVKMAWTLPGTSIVIPYREPGAAAPTGVVGRWRTSNLIVPQFPAA